MSGTWPIVEKIPKISVDIILVIKYSWIIKSGKEMTTPYQAGFNAFHAGLTEDQNPFIQGRTKLGNPRLAEGGEDWAAGWTSYP